MNWARCMDPLCCLCHAGAVVGSYSIGGWVTGSSPFNDKYFFIEIIKFSENIKAKLTYCQIQRRESTHAVAKNLNAKLFYTHPAGE